MKQIPLFALLLLNVTIFTLLPPAPGPATPAAVSVETLDRLAGDPAFSADLARLQRTRARVEEERQALRALGRRMAGILDGTQARWLAAQRDAVSLERFEKPYWDRLLARLRP